MLCAQISCCCEFRKLQMDGTNSQILLRRASVTFEYLFDDFIYHHIGNVVENVKFTVVVLVFFVSSSDSCLLYLEIFFIICALFVFYNNVSLIKWVEIRILRFASFFSR